MNPEFAISDSTVGHQQSTAIQLYAHIVYLVPGWNLVGFVMPRSLHGC